MMKGKQCYSTPQLSSVAFAYSSRTIPLLWNQHLLAQFIRCSPMFYVQKLCLPSNDRPEILQHDNGFPTAVRPNHSESFFSTYNEEKKRYQDPWSTHIVFLPIRFGAEIEGERKLLPKSELNRFLFPFASLNLPRKVLLF
ncbi:hypothetical protein TNCT_202161 [Trichonephila clavata]|uniref:Uncharacterized protein n=1 Tax=Trichonephila clavata TaxID=2740835 RepID=A0A8X6J1H7_TRICU|nr:hypothetical protein TNCT_202161 [Trichonephila clavata]